MRSPSFALLTALCFVCFFQPFTSRVAAQSIRTQVLPSQYSRFGDNYTRQIPAASPNGAKSDLIAVQRLVFPNGVKDVRFGLTFNLATAADLDVFVFDEAGEAVAAQHFGQLPEGPASLDFELSDFPAGTYYLKLQNGTGGLTIAFVVEE